MHLKDKHSFLTLFFKNCLFVFKQEENDGPVMSLTRVVLVILQCQISNIMCMMQTQFLTGSFAIRERQFPGCLPKSAALDCSLGQQC